MVGLHWGDIEYLENNLDLGNVGLIIFDEVQYMGAATYRKALDIALPYIEEKYHIPILGATATVERKDVDVCDKYFTAKLSNGDLFYCWGDHNYTLDEAFSSGLLLPPEYQYIETDTKLIKKARQTRKAVLDELKAEVVHADNNGEKQARFKDMKELQSSVIKNADRIVHDTMLDLYQCNNIYNTNTNDVSQLESLPKANKGTLEKPDNLPSYMRFLVFTPDRESMGRLRKDENSNEVFGGIVEEIYNYFHSAFGRYGYTVKTTIISSQIAEERKNVGLIDPDPARALTEKEAERVIVERPMTIDLIFSINMLNVGYHVNSITGLVLKRWTGSNTIYFQQLGRCLSADSDNIPVVFDFVKSIDDRGITAPLFAVDKERKATTKMADGTTSDTYKGKRKTKKKDTDEPERVNAYIRDAFGNLTSPKWCNRIDAKYITVGTTSATVSEITQRMHVYLNRKTSRELFEATYKEYISHIVVKDNKLTSDVRNIGVLRSLLYMMIFYKYKDKLDGINEKQYTQNTKALYEYIKNKGYNVYIEYNSLSNYVNKNYVNDVLVAEVNSMLAISKSKNSTTGAQLNILLNEDDVQRFKSDKTVIQLLQTKEFNKNNIVIYSM
jgi:superfamily II DNA or RNA helicase